MVDVPRACTKRTLRGSHVYHATGFACSGVTDHVSLETAFSMPSAPLSSTSRVRTSEDPSLDVTRTCCDSVRFPIGVRSVLTVNERLPRSLMMGSAVAATFRASWTVPMALWHVPRCFGQPQTQASVLTGDVWARVAPI